MTTAATDQGDHGLKISAPSLSLDHVRKELEILHRAPHRTPRSALYAELSEPARGRAVTVTFEGHEKTFRVVETTGELDLRRKLADEKDHHTVYIVPFARRLPRDLEATFAAGRVWWPREETTLPRRFGARTGTLRLLGSKLRLVAQRDNGREYDLGDAPSIDLDDAWLVFLRNHLGTSVLDTETQLFSFTLLDRDGRGKALGLLFGTVPGAQKELESVLAQRLGSCAGPILGAWLSERSVELAAMSIVGEATREVLVERTGSFALLSMALEMHIAQSEAHPLRSVHGQDGTNGLAKVLVELGHLIASVWERLRDQENEPLRRAILKQAESLLDKEQLRPLAFPSTRLQFAFEHRRRAFERAIQAIAAATEPTELARALVSVDQASYELREHDIAKADRQLLEQITMASRLAAFLAEPLPPSTASQRTEVIQLARFQLEIGGWVDWARQIVRQDASGPLGKSLLGLVARVDRIRDALDTRFATAYAGAVGHQGDRRTLAGSEVIDGDNAKALLIEDALAKTALELLEHSKDLRLLILCMDGMSTANLAELWSSVAATSLVPVSQGRRWPVIAHVPTITKLSRTAMFAGHAIGPGESTETARDEERLAKHPIVVRMGERATVLLRADMLGTGGGLSDDAATAVRSQQRIVGVVVNAIDDQLSGSAQMRVTLSSESIRPFKGLIDAAESAGRLVLLSSDHGNISSQRFVGVAVRPTSRELEGIDNRGARYRLLASGEAPAADEVELPSGALKAPNGITRVAAAVSETVRYSSVLHAGEHGGATLAEAIAPFVLLAPRGLLPELKNLHVEETPVSPPRFWERDDLRPAPIPPPEAAAPPMAAPTELHDKKPKQASFPFQGEAPELASGLFKSKLFREQTRHLGESELVEVRRAIEVLLRQGGQMTWEKLATELDLGKAVRVPGFVDRLERVLNYGGDMVIEADRRTQRVTIDRPLLKSIFLEDDDG